MGSLCCIPQDRKGPKTPKKSDIQPENRTLSKLDANTDLPERGLPNLGNTCFANAVLVCLWVTPGFRKLLHTSPARNEFAEHFSNLFANSKASVQGILRLLPAFNDRRQHCSHSLYTNIISKLVVNANTGPITFKDQPNDNLTAELTSVKGPMEFGKFGSVWQTMFTCQECKRMWKVGSCGYSLSLPVPQTYSRMKAGGYRTFDSGFFSKNALDCTLSRSEFERFNSDSLGDSQRKPPSEPLSVNLCFEYLQRVTLMTDENKLDCIGCEGDTQHYKHTVLIHCPEVLVIHFQRYSEASGQKLDSMIGFPKTLDLAKVVQQGALKDERHYKLYAVVHHAGTLTSGHFWADIYHDKRWYRFDDSSRSDTTWGDVLASTAYVLFYSKKTDCCLYSAFIEDGAEVAICDQFSMYLS